MNPIEKLKNRQNFIFLLLTLFFFPFLSYADEEENRRTGAQRNRGTDEAPAALFQTKINDREVDLYLEGSWDISITGSIGYDFSAGRFIESPFPQMTPGFEFNQIPNFIVSLWLMDRFFFEATIREEGENNTFLLGYQGKEGEFVQRVLLGNTRIEIEDYAFLSIPSIPSNSLGLSAAFQTRRSYHELLLRYDPAEVQSREFIGNNEVKRQTFMPTDYYRGRFFILPDTNFEDLVVYIEDDNGNIRGSDNRRYRRADNRDFTFSSEDGTLRLRRAAESRVLVYYRVNGVSIGTLGLGIGALPEVDAFGTPQPHLPAVDFNWSLTNYPLPGQNMLDRQVLISGKNALLIFNRGEFSPFESLSYYKSFFPLPEDSFRVRFGISSKSDPPEVIRYSFNRGSELRFRIIREDNLLYVYANSNGVRDMHNRYPFSNRFRLQGDENRLIPVYGPSRNTIPGSYSRELRLEVLMPVGAFMLDPGIIPGSVVVMRNGNRETMFDVDYRTGILTFRTYIHPNDRIRVTYKTSFADTDGGDLLFATGNRFFIGDYLTTELAFGIRWNILQNQYSRFPGQHKGAMLFTGGAEYVRDDLRGGNSLRVGVNTGVSITSQDTTGILRLFDMQQSGITMRLGRGNIFPASVPSWDCLPPASRPLTTRYNRGKLIYKDFHSYTLTTSTLNNYNWSVPRNQIFDYVTGNPIGPYHANAAHVGIIGEVLIMDMEEVPRGRWVGAQVPIIRNAARQDLSDAESISFQIKWENIPTGGKFYIQIGSISEDLDDTGILRQGFGGFPFHDVANGTVMRIGGVGGSRAFYSNDMDLSGVLDLEDPRNIVTIDLDDDGALVAGRLGLISFANDQNSGGWLRVTHRFTPEQKRRLAQSSAVRFIYINDNIADIPSSGKILIGELFIQSSPFSATVISPGGFASAKEVYERFAPGEEAPARRLLVAYPEVRDIFFRNADIVTTQKILKAEWKGDEFTLTGYSTPVPYGMYRKLAGYINIHRLGDPDNPCLDEAEFTISFTDAFGRGITATFKTASFPDWKKFEIDLERRRIYLGGVNIGGTVRTTPTNLGLTKLKITSDAYEGIMFIDEIHFTDPRLSVAGAVAATFEYNIPGPVLTIGETDVISNFSIREYVMFVAEDFSVDLNENSSESYARTRTSISTDIFRSSLAANIDFSRAGSDNFSTIDHIYRTPLFTNFIMYTNSFSESRDLHFLSFSKHDELSIRIGERGGIASVSAESISIFDSLSQRWNFRYRSDTRRQMHGGSSLSFTKVSNDFVPHDSHYLANWINSFSLLLPYGNDPWPDRTISSENNFSLMRESFGINLLFNAGTSSSGENFDRRQRNSGRMEIQFPIFNQSLGGWRLTPGYSRTFEYTNRNAPGRSFMDDTQLWFENFSEQSYFYTGIPFLEFFSDRFEKKFMERSSSLSSSRYTPEVFLRFSRRRSSSLADFFAPSEFNARYSKEFAKEDDTFTHTYRISAQYVTRAINMFGSAGVNPIFNFYRTDEFVTRISVTASSIDTHIPQDRELSIRNSLYFAGHGERELILDNRFGYVHRFADNRTFYHNTTSASFMWVTRPNRRIEVRHLTDRNAPDPYFVHTETIVFTTQPESNISDNNLWSLLLTHETSLIFPDRGSLRLLFSMGIERRKLYDFTGDENNYLLGLQLGLFGRITF
ncbi:MAG: hypothetical protein FWC36_02895 [Spirochaetes bacterium]|nr:hypothetical protein [Spirochaetota bacterium]